MFCYEITSKDGKKQTQREENNNKIYFMWMRCGSVVCVWGNLNTTKTTPIIDYENILKMEKDGKNFLF